MEEHLVGCDPCQERAEAVTPDTFVRLLASARTRIDLSRSAAATPSPTGFATPSLSRTRAWDDALTEVAETEVPAVLVGHPKYHVIRRLGTGGMGTVWLAEHT